MSEHVRPDSTTTEQLSLLCSVIVSRKLLQKACIMILWAYLTLLSASLVSCKETLEDAGEFKYSVCSSWWLLKRRWIQGVLRLAPVLFLLDPLYGCYISDVECSLILQQGMFAP